MSERRKGFTMLDLDGPNGRVLGYALDEGEVTDAELEPYWQLVDRAIDSGQKLRVYAEMRALPTFGQDMVVEKLKRLTHFTESVERMAIVGDARWLTTYARSIAPFLDAEVRHFPMSAKDEALAWIRE